MTVQALRDYWAQLEKSRGLPPGYLERTRNIESSGGRNLYSPTGPIGPFQFTRSTANMVNLPLDKRLDERESARAAADLAANNQSILRRALGRDPQGHELYIAHQQGGPGAARLLTNPNKPAGSLVPGMNIAVNAGDPNAPAQSILQKFKDKFLNQSGAPVPPQNVGVGGGPPLPPERPLGLADATPPARPAGIGNMPAPVINEGGGLLGMAKRWWNGVPSATAVAPTGPVTPEALAAAPAAPKPVSELTSFMGSPQMAASLKGAGMLANALQGQQAAAAPAPITEPIDANIPDISTLMAKLKKRGQL